MKMADFSRRKFLGTASLAAGLAAAESSTEVDGAEQAEPARGGDESLPEFRYEIEKSRGKVVGGNSAREATVRQLPISTGLAGVSMRLEPGGMRELHWHAIAAEWAFMIEGRCRTTVIAPDGSSEINDFNPGDVWYFPRGHGHSLQGLGPGTCHFVLVFDSGSFSEFGTFSVTDWLTRTPKHIVAQNLGLPVDVVEKLPDHEVYFARGKVPPPIQEKPHQYGLVSSPNTHRYPLMDQSPSGEFQGGKEWRVSAREFPISQTITGVILDLEPGALRELHWHPNADEWQYIIKGEYEIGVFGSGGRARHETFKPGDVGYIPRGYGHYIHNKSKEAGRILIAFNTGEYQEISLSTWLASNPDTLIGENLELERKNVDRLPKGRLFIAPERSPIP
jgi:oxalate decarboxylase